MKALALVALVACGHGPQRVGNEPSWRNGGSGSGRDSGSATSVVIPQTFAPTAEAARNYNEPLQAPPSTPLGDAIVAAVKDAADKLHLPTPVADARLFRACTELAEIAPDDGRIDNRIVEFAMRRNGIIEPSPYLLVVWGDPADTTQVLGQIQPELANILGDGATARVGIGSAKRNADGGGVVVFALQGSGVATAPIPRALPQGGSFAIDAVIDSHYRDPEVFVTRASGTTDKISLQVGRAGAFTAKIDCGKERGRQQVEIGANTARGSVVLANFPVWCGVAPPASISIAPMSSDDAQVTSSEAEHRLLAMINHDRTAAGLSALIWDDGVAAVARAHSQEMHKTNIVAHTSPTTGTASDRLNAANIKSSVVLENVARAYGVDGAHEGLMNSPGHRANIMFKTATHVGIGIVYGDEVGAGREMFVTELFIRIPPKVDAAHAAEVVRQRIDAVRHVGVDAHLTSIATQVAEGLAAGKSRDQLWPAASKQLDKLTQYERVRSVITAAAELDVVDAKELLGDHQPDDIGVGIAQGPHPEIGEGAIWIVVLFAERPKK